MHQICLYEVTWFSRLPTFSMTLLSTPKRDLFLNHANKLRFIAKESVGLPVVPCFIPNKVFKQSGKKVEIQNFL